MNFEASSSGKCTENCAIMHIFLCTLTIGQNQYTSSSGSIECPNYRRPIIFVKITVEIISYNGMTKCLNSTVLFLNFLRANLTLAYFLRNNSLDGWASLSTLAEFLAENIDELFRLRSLRTLNSIWMLSVLSESSVYPVISPIDPDSYNIGIIST
jgi:hypothetical protein